MKEYVIMAAIAVVVVVAYHMAIKHSMLKPAHLDEYADEYLDSSI